MSQTFEFTSIEEAKLSPFATALFQFPFVKAVFIDKNYVSVTKYDIVEWEAITLELREFMKSYIEDGKEMVICFCCPSFGKNDDSIGWCL